MQSSFATTTLQPATIPFLTGTERVTLSFNSPGFAQRASFTPVFEGYPAARPRLTRKLLSNYLHTLYVSTVRAYSTICRLHSVHTFPLHESAQDHSPNVASPIQRTLRFSHHCLRVLGSTIVGTTLTMKDMPSPLADC